MAICLIQTIVCNDYEKNRNEKFRNMENPFKFGSRVFNTNQSGFKGRKSPRKLKKEFDVIFFDTIDSDYRLQTIDYRLQTLDYRH